MSDYNQYDGQGMGSGFDYGPPGAGAPPDGPPMGQGYQPYQPTQKRSGCTGCLLGCLIVFAIFMVLVIGVGWYGMSWLRKNILEQEPLPIATLKMSDEKVEELKKTVDEVLESDAEVQDLTFTAEEVRYLILASQWTSQHSPGAPMEYPPVDKLNQMDTKFDISFPEEDTLEFSLSMPFTGSKYYLNLVGAMKLKIDEKNSVMQFERIKIGKFDLNDELEEIARQQMENQMETDQRVQELRQQIPFLKIEPGKVRMRVIVAQPEQAP